jgi:hypothetical protein
MTVELLGIYFVHLADWPRDSFDRKLTCEDKVLQGNLTITLSRR